MIGQLLLGGGEPLVICDAADFDGTNDLMSRASLDGIADSKSGIFSGWLRLDGGDAADKIIFRISSSAGVLSFQVFRNAANKLRLQATNSSSVLIIAAQTDNNLYTASSSWLHILFSWDLAAGSIALYVNDALIDLFGSISNATIDYTRDDTFIGGIVSGGKLDGCQAEIYFAPGQFLSLSNISNRRKFISGGGKPVFLGSDGSLPTGTAPIVYMHLDNGEAVANFATNRGTGGNFTITGTLDTASTSPSD